MIDALRWLLALELLGAIAAPFAFVLLPGLRDRGFAFAKPLGLLMLAYPLWLVGSAGALPVNGWTVAAAVVALGAAAGALAYRRRDELRDFVRREWRLLLAVEGAFLLVFVGWTVLKAANPAIAHTEQPMDFGFLNAALRATSFPPEDPWLRGHGISYYYFGYLIMATLAKLSAVAPSVAYNLALATIPALASAGVMGLVITLTTRAGARLGTAVALGASGFLLLVAASNLEGVLEMVRAWGLGTAGFWEAVGIKGLDGPAATSSLFPQENWWWWRATRVIDTVVDGASLDYTIQEFPFFSIFLGDLHPHVMSLPFVLTSVALSLDLALDDGRPDASWLARRWASVVAMGLVVGALGFINTWDLPVFLALALGAVALVGYRHLRLLPRREDDGGSDARGYAVVRTAWLLMERWPWRTIGALSAVGALVVGLVIVPFLPYYLGVDTQASGVLPVDAPGTSAAHFIVVWGLFLAALAPFVALQLSRSWRGVSMWQAAAALEIAAAPLFLWLLAAPIFGMLDAMPGRVLFVGPLALATALMLLRAMQAAREGEPALAFVLGLLTLAAFLLMGPELFYLVDFFNTRMNTIFKLYYQAWAVLAVAVPVTLYYSASAIARRNLWVRRAGALWWVLVATVALGSLYYPVGALASTGNQPLTLDGLAFLERQQPDERAAIRWLSENSERGDGIVEAVDGDYGPFGRVSAYSGVPTVLAWPGHELQWRGSSEPQGSRVEDIAALYRATAPEAAETILRRYDVTFVVLGPRERSKYGTESLDHLQGLLDPAFSRGAVTVYRVRTTDG